MTEVEGRLEDGQKAHLRYEKEKIEIKIEKGFLKKTRVPLTNITIQDINSIKLEKEEKNNITKYKLIINYLEKEDVLFISSERLNEIIEAHEEYQKKIERAKANYYQVREKNLMNISLNLDFCNTLFKILESSNGPIEWEKIYEHFYQLELIYKDINLMGDSKIYNFSLDNFRNLINNRLMPEILNEIYELLETLLRTSIQTSKNKVDFFNEEYHRLFTVTLFRIWDYRLSKVSLNERLDKNSLINDIEIIIKYLLTENIEVKLTSSECLEAINHLNYWIHLLLNVPFKKQ